MNSKKAITLLVLASMILALVPVVPVQALAVPTLDVATGDKGDTVKVTGVAGDVPAGTVVELYWDDTTIAWNGVKGKLNDTVADSNGNYEIWFDVPENKYGNHYVWIKAVATGETKASAAFLVTPKLSLSSSSGLANDKVDISGYGQTASKDVALIYVDTATAGAGATAIGALAATAVAAEQIGTGDGAETEFEGTLNNIPIQPGTFVPAVDGANAWTDNGDGTVTNAGAADEGSINYATGEYSLTYNVAPGAGAVNAAYSHFAEVANTYYVLSTTGSTNTLGSYTKRVTIPGGINQDYYIYSLDQNGKSTNVKFSQGAVITVSPEDGAVGDIVTVKGRGFTAGTITYGATPAAGVDGIALGTKGCVVDDYPVGGVVVNAAGEFTMNIFVPETGDEDDFVLKVGDGSAGGYAEADFEVTDLSSITVTPDYGPQGHTVSIDGENFPNKKDTTINVQLNGGGLGAPVAIKTFDVNADGSFSGTFRVPAEVDGTYDIEAFWANPAPLAGNNIEADDTFRIGSVLVLLSDDEGPAGMQITLSGNGFTAGEKWNATFGGIAIFEDKDVAVGGLLKDGGAAANFMVPQVDPGVYDIVVLDVDTGIEVTVQFTVTAATSFEWDPAIAPSGYNVTLMGHNWSEDDTVNTYEFVLFNATEEWDITALVGTGAGGATPFTTGLPDGDNPGEWAAWWIVGNAAGDIDKGTYTLNITYGDDFFMQVDFEVGDVHSSIGPRKATFKIGDTVSFNIEHSFGDVAEAAGGEINSGNLKIYDPAGNLYWETDALADWTKREMYYYVPAADQLENGNALILLDDAPLGEWMFKWYENNAVAGVGGDGSLIEEGTFMVEAAATDVISGQVEDLANALDDLSSDLSGVTSEFDDVKSDIASVESAVADAISAAEAAAEAVTAVAATANTASEAAADAAEAANAARDAASGLTTLVYGAIGAALVAALAAIVSLMQISRRIAG